MKSPFDQNPEQEAEQQYERNLSRNYAPSERAEIRRSDQRASYNEAVLKQRAEIAGANAEIARSKLGVMEERLGLADIQSKIAQEKAELTQNDLKVKAARELKVISDANGFLRDAVGMDPSRPSFDTQYQKMLAGYPDAFESKAVKEWSEYHVPIAKSRREKEDLIAKEERARNKEVEERNIARVAAQEAGAVPTKFTVGGETFETPTKADAASLEKETKAEMASLEKERKISVDQFAKARNARTRAGIVLATALETKNEKAINAANDLIKAADEDVIEMRAKRDEAESALKVRVSNKAPAEGKQPQATVGNPNGMPTPAAPAAPTEAKEFASEAEARKSGAKAGDIIILINPRTGKPGRARLD
jgi:hypothetical protein